VSVQDQNFDKFKENLVKSQEGVNFAANYLLSMGHDVLVKATHIAPSREQWKDYTDSGDLYIQQRIEIKHLSAQFTDSYWPFGSKFLVCAKHSFDQSTPKPYAYLYFSKDKDYVASVLATTRPHWYVEPRTDKRYEQYQQDFYLCPLEHVRFTKVVS